MITEDELVVVAFEDGVYIQHYHTRQFFWRDFDTLDQAVHQIELFDWQNRGHMFADLAVGFVTFKEEVTRAKDIEISVMISHQLGVADQVREAVARFPNTH